MEQANTPATGLVDLETVRLRRDGSRLRLYQYLLERHIAGETEPLGIADLEWHLDVSREVVSTGLSVLRRAGLVELQRHKEDARRTAVMLSPAGIAAGKSVTAPDTE